VLVLVHAAREDHETITVPAGCVAQAWRAPARQARVAAFLRMPNVEVVALDDAEARAVGLLLARTKTSDVTDAHVALCAIRRQQLVVTSDPSDIRRLAPGLPVHRV
jgi:hypothetical protein